MMANSRINTIHYPTIPPQSKQVNQKKAVQQSFQTILENQKAELKVSKHAQKRLDERNIQISPSHWNEIHEKMLEAKQKGVTDSVIVTKDAVLVASTKNHTIITALDKNNHSDQLITNINGTIILPD